MVTGSDLEIKALISEWRKRIASYPEAKQASDNLEFYRRKVRRMTEELHVAEEWEKELVRRVKTTEESVKTPLMKISESFEKSSEVEDSFLEAAIKEEVQDRLIAMLRKKALAMDTMDRAQLLAFVKTFCQFCFPPLYR